MTFKKLLLTAAAAAVLTTTGAGMAMARDRDHDGRPDRSWAEAHDRDGHERMDRREDRREMRHDRYWRAEYRGGYVDRDRVFIGLRSHHYNRFVGDPFWLNGRYVVKTYRHGHIVLVEVNPYTAGFIGEIRF